MCVERVEGYFCLGGISFDWGSVVREGEAIGGGRVREVVVWRGEGDGKRAGDKVVGCFGLASEKQGQGIDLPCPSIRRTDSRAS